MSDQDTNIVQVFLLGCFEIVWGEKRLEAADWKRRKAAALLQRLALEGSLPKEKAIDFLWPEASLSSGSNNLYRTLYALRQVLNDAFGPEADPHFFTFVNGVLFLDEAVSVDAVEFETLLGNPSLSIAERQEADALYRGELLPDDPYSDWLAFPRERLRRLRRENSIALASHFEAEQAYEQAIPLLAPLVAEDSLDELLHRTLMRLYARSGQYALALRQYHICAQTLQVELGVEPEAETEMLKEAIESREIGPAPSQPGKPVAADEPTTAAPVLRHNLPAFADAFVGRDGELDRVQEYLTQSECRLLTISGIGGIGKTRLAIQAAHALIDSDFFPDGLFFVDLAGIESTDYLIATIDEALGFAPAEATSDPLEQLVDYLRSKELLLILDNFEQLQVAAPQLSLLLRHCPHLKLLVTSRHQLKLGGELTLVLDGLPRKDNWNRNVAAHLFRERARQAAPDLDLEAERLFIQAICELVVGMPLAIEMCAAWVQTLSCYEILAELNRGLDLLEIDRADAPDRHLSIRAVFETSLKLLSPRERKLLLNLAVFRGGFSPEAGREVAGATLSHLRALVEKSLLRKRTEAAQSRYQMHPLLRQFALERLDQEDLAATRGRLADYFGELLTELAQKRCTPENEAITATVFMEADNLRGVWQWVGRQIAGEQDSEQLAQLVDKLMPAWGYAYMVYSHALEGKQLLDLLWQPMAAAGWEKAAGRQRTSFGKVTMLLAYFSQVLGQFEEAIHLSHQAVSLLQTQPDPESQPASEPQADYIAHALRTEARALMRLGRYEEAEPKLEQSLALAQETLTRARTTHFLGTLNMQCGEYDTAFRYLTEARDLFEQCHEQRQVLRMMQVIGALHGRQRRFEEAVAYYKQVTRLARRIDQKATLMIALNNMAFCLHQLGQSARIEEYYEEALALAVELGIKRWQSVISQEFGIYLLERGMTERAVDLMKQGLQSALALNSQPDVMAGLLHLAHWQAQRGRFEEAMVAAGYILAGTAANEETRSYAADLWDDLSSELPEIFTQRAEATLATASLDDVLAMLGSV